MVKTLKISIVNGQVEVLTYNHSYDCRVYGSDLAL